MVVSLQAETTVQPIKIACEGHVVRSEPRPSTRGFAMAVEFVIPCRFFRRKWTDGREGPFHLRYAQRNSRDVFG